MAGEPERERATQSLMVPSEDPEKKEKKHVNGKDVPDSKDDKKDAAKKKEDELNEEDLQLKNELEMLVERLKVRLVSVQADQEGRVVIVLTLSPYRRRTRNCIGQRSSR